MKNRTAIVGPHLSFFQFIAGQAHLRRIPRTRLTPIWSRPETPRDSTLPARWLVCALRRQPVPNTLRDVAPGPAPARDTWFIEPAKVFDNLYFVGSKIHSSWALTSSEGIILIDTLWTYNSEEEIVGGLKKLGFDPAKVKYVIISHAHPDHVGGAKLMQDRFGSRIVMGGPDWDSIEKSVNGYPLGKPKRDIVADDGQKITLGDTSVTLIATPGHTPGTLSMIFTVKDNGKPLTVAYSGGTAFNFPSTAVELRHLHQVAEQDGSCRSGGERDRLHVEPLGI